MDLDFDDIVFGGIFGLILSLFIPGFMRKHNIDPIRVVADSTKEHVEVLEEELGKASPDLATLVKEMEAAKARVEAASKTLA